MIGVLVLCKCCVIGVQVLCESRVTEGTRMHDAGQ